MLESPEDSDRNRIGRLACHRRNLRRKKSPDKTILQHVPVCAWHLCKLLERSFAVQFAERVMPWVDCRFESRLQQLIERCFFLPADMIEKKIMRDAVQERANMHDFLLTLETLAETEKYILHEIFGDFAVSTLPIAIAKDGLMVEVIDIGEIVNHGRKLRLCDMCDDRDGTLTQVLRDCKSIAHKIEGDRKKVRTLYARFIVRRTADCIAKEPCAPGKVF